MTEAVNDLQIKAGLVPGLEPRDLTQEAGDKVTETLQPGRLVRTHWDGGPILYIDTEVHEGDRMIVDWYRGRRPKIIGKGNSSTVWRPYRALVSPDPNLNEGHIGWRRNADGKLEALMHPDFLKAQADLKDAQKEPDLTLGLEDFK